MEILSRSIETTETPHGVLLAATQTGAGEVACFFKSGLAADAIAGHESFTDLTVTGIGSGARVTGTARPDTEGRIALPLQGAPGARLAPPEPDLFRGLDTALALRGLEDAETIRQWLAYHARHHGLEAALILDRRSPGPSALPDALAAAGPVPGIARLLIVTLDTPTGHPGAGDEALPYLAPDAPGKDRMEVPDPDPWAAPFGEHVLYEALRTLWLGTARAVMNVDLSDLVQPLETGTIFDRAREAPSGAVQLLGHRVYPWAVKPGAAPRFGDHVCTRFDGDPANPRWCTDPARAPEDATWRMIRIRGSHPGPLPSFPYWRCMALRHPTGKVSEIVPKSSLVEDPALIALMEAEFDGTEARRPPPEELAPAAAKPTNRTGIVTTMKNEGPFILEWLAHHRALGIEDFLIYTNDCTDGTDTLLDLLERKGLVRHRENPFRETGLKPQHAALQDADEDPGVRALDWVICMDVDEFINIHAGEGTLADLYTAVPGANMISMTWRLFGNADIHGYEDRLITEQFTRCAPEYARKPHQAWGFKSAVRNTGIFKKLGVHRPKGLRPQLVDQLNWVNGSGKPMPEKEYRNAWRSTTDTYGYELVTLNHYALRSAESFLVKRDRGRVNHVDRDQGLAYWFRMNNNAEEDRSIQRRLPALRAELARLMADPEIAAAHLAATAAHRAKIDALRATERYAAFYAEITGERLSRLSRMHAHFGAKVFLAGPDCIPDAALDHAGEEGFFFGGPGAEVAG